MSKEVYFSFGPGDSFIFSGPKGHISDGINPAFWREAGKRSKSVKQIQCFAMGENGETFAVWKGSDDKVYQWVSPSLKESKMYEGLYTIHKDHGSNTRAVFGPKGLHMAWVPGSDAICCSILKPNTAEKQSAHSARAKLKVSALGVDGTGFLMGTSNRFWYGLGENYTLLGEYLKLMPPSALKFLALNPYREEQFFLLMSNDTAIFRVPLSYTKKVEEALEKCGIPCLALSSQRGYIAPTNLLEAARNGPFLKGLVESAAPAGVKTEIDNAITVAVTGSAACHMM